MTDSALTRGAESHRPTCHAHRHCEHAARNRDEGTAVGSRGFAAGRREGDGNMCQLSRLPRIFGLLRELFQVRGVLISEVS